MGASSPDVRSTRRPRFGPALLATCLLAGGALAYVLPQGSILRRLVEAREELQLSSVEVKGTLTLEGETLRTLAGPLGVSAGQGAARVDGTWSLMLPGRCRFEAGSMLPGDPRRAAAVNAGGKRFAVGTESPALATAVDEVCALLALRAGGSQSRGALEGHLRALGVDSRSSSLQRFGGQVVYALGDTSDDKFAQLWVYKQSFQPARMRWTAKDGTRWDVWLVDYGAPPAGEAFPRVIEVHRNGERQLRFDALAWRRDPKLAAGLFAAPKS